MQKKRLLLIGNAYWVPMNRRKAVELSRWFEVVCVTHSPKGHCLMGRSQADESVTDKSTRLLEAKGTTQGGTKFTLVGLEGAVEEFQPDLILVETEPWARLFWQVVRAQKRYSPQAHLVLFSWENIRREGLKGSILDQVYRLAGRKLAAVIAGNEDAKRLFEKAGVSKERIHVDAQLGFSPEQIPDDPSAWRRELRSKWGTSSETLVVGFCGRFVSEKGVWDLLSAIESLQGGFAVPIELQFLGGGPLEVDLQEFALSRPWFRLHEPVPHDEVVSLMCAWDFFVLPSKRLQEKGRVWEEQFGHVLLNAMGAGCLTLGSRSGAIPEVLAHDEEVIFEPGDPEGLANLLAIYLTDKSLCEEKVKAQRKRAHEFYSFKQIATRYHEHFERRGLL